MKKGLCTGNRKSEFGLNEFKFENPKAQNVTFPRISKVSFKTAGLPTALGGYAEEELPMEC